MMKELKAVVVAKAAAVVEAVAGVEAAAVEAAATVVVARVQEVEIAVALQAVPQGLVKHIGQTSLEVEK
jgi:hypothetical protein